MLKYLLLFCLICTPFIYAEDKVEPTPEVTDDTFKAEVQDSKGVTIVDFYGMWCGPCRRMLPIINEFSNLKICKVMIYDTTPNQIYFIRADIPAIPCCVIYKNGVEFTRHYGTHTVEQMKQWVLDAK